MKLSRIHSLFIIFFTCSLNVNRGYAETPRIRDLEARLGIETLPRLDGELREPLSVEQVVAFLRLRPEIQTIEEFLPRLPQSFRFRKVLAFDSRSRQAASPSHPRIVLMSADASFVLTVTGANVGRGSSEIEMMQFKGGSAMGFQFASYSFEREQNSRQPIGYSGINPPQCLECHERNSVARPFWEPYNTWIGFYGQSNHSPFVEMEETFFQRFQRTLRQAPGRYASLFENPATVNSTSVPRFYTAMPRIDYQRNYHTQLRTICENLRRVSLDAFYNEPIRSSHRSGRSGLQWREYHQQSSP